MMSIKMITRIGHSERKKEVPWKRWSTVQGDSGQQSRHLRPELGSRRARRIISPYLLSGGWTGQSTLFFLDAMFLWTLSISLAFIRHVQETFGHPFPSRVDWNPLPSKIGMNMVLHEHREVERTYGIIHVSPFFTNP